jgi:hypothetical protein
VTVSARVRIPPLRRGAMGVIEGRF